MRGLLENEGKKEEWKKTQQQIGGDDGTSLKRMSEVRIGAAREVCETRRRRVMYPWTIGHVEVLEEQRGRIY